MDWNFELLRVQDQEKEYPYCVEDPWPTYFGSNVVGQCHAPSRGDVDEEEGSLSESLGWVSTFRDELIKIGGEEFKKEQIRAAEETPKRQMLDDFGLVAGVIGEIAMTPPSNRNLDERCEELSKLLPHRLDGVTKADIHQWVVCLARIARKAFIRFGEEKPQLVKEHAGITLEDLKKRVRYWVQARRISKILEGRFTVGDDAR